MKTYITWEKLGYSTDILGLEALGKELLRIKKMLTENGDSISETYLTILDTMAMSTSNMLQYQNDETYVKNMLMQDKEHVKDNLIIIKKAYDID